MSTGDPITKLALKEGLLRELDTIISDLHEEMDSLHKGVDLDEEDTMDPEDFSHQTEAGDLERSHEQRLNMTVQKRERLEKLPTHDQTEVGVGAVVETEGHIFFISVAARPYDVNGHIITPLSLKAPLYQELHDSKVGDKIVLGNVTETIKRIW